MEPSLARPVMVICGYCTVETMKVTYLNFNTNKTKRFRELYGPDAVIDEFYTDSKFDQPMIDMARHAFMVKGNTITQVK